MCIRDRFTGVRSARKHIGWYLRHLPGGEDFRTQMNALEDSGAQWQAVADFMDALAAESDRMPAPLAPQHKNDELEEAA